MELQSDQHVRKLVEVREVKNGYLVLFNTVVCNSAGQPLEQFQEQMVSNTPSQVGGFITDFLLTDLLALPDIPDTSEDHQPSAPEAPNAILGLGPKYDPFLEEVDDLGD